MVQSSKLGIIPIQSHHHHPPPQNLKSKNPTPVYHHQLHGLPAELTKKMKRSGSAKKASDFHKISQNQRKPTSVATSAPPPSTPQKSPPNYMKSTSSSEARKDKDKEKERSPVSKSFHLDRKHPINSASSPASSSGKRKPSAAVGDEGRSAALKKKKKTTARALTKVPSFKKCSSKVGPKNVMRSTCSSTMKDSKFPPYLVLDHGATEAQGTSAMKVCPYTYCSLNGHHHRQPDLPPLKCFLKTKRRSLKAQKSVKLGGSLSPRSRPVAGEIVGVSDVDQADFFVEFFTKEADNHNNDAPTMEDVKLVEEQDPLESEFERDNMNRFGDMSSSADEMVEISSFDGGIEDGSMEEDDEEDDQSSEEGTEMEWVQGLDSSSSQVGVEGEQLLEFEKHEMVKSNDIASSSCTEEVLTKELLRDLFEEETEGATSSATSEFGGNDGFQNWEDDDDAFQKLEEEKGTDGETCSVSNLGQTDMEVFSVDEVNEIFEADIDSTTEYLVKEGDDMVEPGNVIDIQTSENQDKTRTRNVMNPDAEKHCSSDKKWKIGSGRGMEEMEGNEREFNPKDPNFLPVIADPEGEKVDLKHQMMDERRNSEEWMIDHALQQTVTKLASARKRKVALLVEAFETVSPSTIPKIDPRIIRHPAASPIFSPTSRQIQACG